MSASREKQSRKERINSGWVDPKVVREEEQKKQTKRANRVYGIIAALFVVVVVVVGVWRSNILTKNAAAVTIDGEKYTAGEVNVYYQNVYQNFAYQYSYVLDYLGLDTTTSLKTQQFNETAATMLGGEIGQSWFDYFLEQGLIQMKTVQNGLKQAEAEGFEFPASVEMELEDTMASMKETADANGVSLDQLLKNYMGSGVTEKVYREHLLRIMQFAAYATAHSDSLTYSDAEIEAAYEEDARVYDMVAYESVFISGAGESTEDADGNLVEPTDEAKEAARDEARKAANDMLAAFKAGGDLETLAEGVEDAVYTGTASSFTYNGDTLGEWLFDDARKPGDSAVLENGSTFYVVSFEKRYREMDETIDVRHVLISPETNTLSTSDEGYEAEQTKLEAAARARAEELLAEWEAGEATEDSFGALAARESADGSKYDGGLYTAVAPGQMVAEFNDWCFDSSRKPGDTGIVDTVYGSHIMYFVQENLPVWEANVVEDLKTIDQADWLDSLAADSTVERHDFGMGFVG